MNYQFKYRPMNIEEDEDSIDIQYDEFDIDIVKKKKKVFLSSNIDSADQLCELIDENINNHGSNLEDCYSIADEMSSAFFDIRKILIQL